MGHPDRLRESTSRFAISALLQRCGADPIGLDCWALSLHPFGHRAQAGYVGLVFSPVEIPAIGAPPKSRAELLNGAFQIVVVAVNAQITEAPDATRQQWLARAARRRHRSQRVR